MKYKFAPLVQALELRAINGLNTPPDLLISLHNSASEDKLILFKNHLNRTIGYLAWAGINKESASRFLKKRAFPFYPYEWSEGGIFLVLDVVVQKKSSFDAVRQIKNLIFSKRAVLFARRDKVKLYLKKDGKLTQRKLTNNTAYNMEHHNGFKTENKK